VVALLGGTIILFQTEAMWHMDSPNAQAWNATYNTTATFGFNIMPIIIIIIIVVAIASFWCTKMGYN
jgi:hypothetical protein